MRTFTEELWLFLLWHRDKLLKKVFKEQLDDAKKRLGDPKNVCYENLVSRLFILKTFILLVISVFDFLNKIEGKCH